MNILMYGWEFPPHISGGLGVACYAIVNELAKKHTNITLILPQIVENPLRDHEHVSIIGCNFLKDFDLTSLKALCLQFNIKDIGSLIHPYISGSNYHSAQIHQNESDVKNFFPLKLSGQYGINLLSEVFHYALIAGALAETVPHDAIHCHDWLTILAGVEAKRHSHKPLIFHVHALEYDRSGDHVNQQVFDIEKYGMEQADRIITVSQYTKNIIAKRYGIPAEKITVVHNGMYYHQCPTPFHKNNAQKMVLFLGRITHQKGPYFFVEIAKKILSKRQDIQFVVVGNGNLTSEMIKHVAASRIGKYVHFTGFLDPDTAQKVYQLADVYVMPSVSEPFGLTCLEALSHQVPIVISKQSGVSEALKHALKADFWDVDDMASKILALLDYPMLRKTMLKNAVQDLKQLTWNRAADKIINVYQQVIGY
jgi:glycosyltransferase involved in cell wall biosynthesis